MPLRGRIRAAAVVTFVIAASALAVAMPASGSPAERPAGCAASGPAPRYIVVFDEDTPETEARSAITRACGDTTVYYPEIAVAVATSADAKFTQRIGTHRAFSAASELSDDSANQRDAADTQGTSTDTEFAPTDPAAVPSADRTGDQWDMRMIGADRARQYQQGSQEVTVGVLDSGIDARHPDLAAAVDPTTSASCVTGKPDTSRTAWAPRSSAHGTHVAGILAAADDGKGITGVAPDTRLASVRVVDDAGQVTPEAAVCGFMWAAKNEMDITNSSFYVEPWLFTCQDGAGQQVVYEALRRAVRYADDRGTLNIAAATNEAADLGTAPGDYLDRKATTPSKGCDVLPAGLSEVVAVSSVGPERVKAGYSSYGLGTIDVTAPGGAREQGRADADSCVLSTVPRGYATNCGTSMAAPHVAGVAALLAAANPDSGPEELRGMLGDQARPVSCPTDYDLSGDGQQDAYCSGYSEYNGFYGNGLVDALAAVTNQAR
ncbi:subtilase family protein [Tamaricihabitans halophyticus]|uniref:Subtilase family protein n=1 Tax=Tamaricihabitans halophyticus TaxID=1262583 RepID=A0A4R2QIJ1_9PSEU|nr:S8 family serine peptidase [Tamaricihabitans halophyticus]TCP48589.1 subtilase family protein [Tamaricihabitans halophyticus]